MWREYKGYSDGQTEMEVLPNVRSEDGGYNMTDEMRAREKAICEVAKVNDIGEVSDGFHTFNGLYEQRMILFAALVKAYKDKSWKSYRHEDGEYCFGGGWFIVGIDTPEGSYTYHYENKYWDMFDCIDLPRAKHWDGHTEADAETRLMSLNPEPHWIPVTERLPEYGVDCIVTVKQKYTWQTDWEYFVDLGWRGDYIDGAWDTANDWDEGQETHISAWMPLPEPFKGVTS